MAHVQFRAHYDHASKLTGLHAQSDRLISALKDDLQAPTITLLNTNASDDQFCLGVGYVFEGSALGANIIQKRRSNAGLRKSAYLNFVTASASLRWPRFIGKLDSYQEADNILLGAVSAFESIIAHAESG